MKSENRKEYYMRKIILLFSARVLLILLPAASVLAQVELDIETGGVFSGYNDVRIPGEGGTLFSLSEELKADPSVFYRIRVFYDLNPRHHLGVLFAPLTIHPAGELDRDLIFEGQDIPCQYAAGGNLSIQFLSVHLSL